MTRCLRKNSSVFWIGLDNKLYFGKGPILFIYSFFFFRLFSIQGRHKAKVFSIRLGQLRLRPLLQPSLCLLSPNPSSSLWPFSLSFTNLFIPETPLILTAGEKMRH